jgi:hypothetical protein
MGDLGQVIYAFWDLVSFIYKVRITMPLSWTMAKEMVPINVLAIGPGVGKCPISNSCSIPDDYSRILLLTGSGTTCSVYSESTMCPCPENNSE